ncbi:amidohydrolase-domain-containing protein [Crepidotus variabilis]|uniref:Amidohydrolase-domain-containing protein n=1 Tax=Crepidotus variabilis TaxID=179855 RepID=A0A9P6JR01_9AGAR|nr:amidohydrolase-domain-containing protein [Crepidotus variabilis]
MTGIEFPILYKAAFSHPAIDNHAHPLLRTDSRSVKPFEGVFSEAEGEELLEGTPHTLACYRGTKQLAELYRMEKQETVIWEQIKAYRDTMDYLELCRLCFTAGKIRCVLMDDGLGGSLGIGEEYKWHDQFTVGKTKRVVRIEVVAEAILTEVLGKAGTPDGRQLLEHFERQLKTKLREYGADSEVVGFKSIVCYRTGLEVGLESRLDDKRVALKQLWYAYHDTGKIRLEHKSLNDEVVRMALDVAAHCGKPVQFHTGLGDNDLTLTQSAPALLQPIIKAYHETVIVLLHASYPYMREAGYLTSVYRNVYLDFGEVFPMVSRSGQKDIIQQLLELTPTNKIMWSSDGRWWPESYYLAIQQAREILYEVLSESILRKEVNEGEATEIISKVLYNNAARLYGV